MATIAGNSISYYKRADRLKPEKEIPFDIFIDNIRSGVWEDIVHPVRIASEEQRDKLKKTVPYVTVSGIFAERRDDNLIRHSGLIGIDIDDVEDVEELKSLICADKHTIAAFTSISGRGLCVVFKIKPDKHKESFQGISEYLFKNYKIIIDPTSINVSRARFISFDPTAYLNERADTFTQYPKHKPPKKIDKAIFDQSDFELILQQIVDRRLNLAEDYFVWRNIGFALASKFGEKGREYYHIISQYSSKYNSEVNDKQYSVNLKRRQDGINIATFYYFAKQAGLQIYSERTKTIAYTAAQGKKGGLNAVQIEENLRKFENITDSHEIVKQVLENDIQLNEDTLLDQLELWTRQNYSLEQNEITRYIENKGVPMQQSDFNTIYIAAKKIFENLTYDLIDRLIHSEFVPKYNPFYRFFADNKELIDLKSNPQHIFRLFSSVKSKDADFVQHFGKKWLVSVISAIHGEHSPLMLILSGDVQNTGKTQWFRRILPVELKPYYAESKLDAGKDDEILMTQKLLIMDDEMGGKSKREIKKLKELTSKQTFSLREPYGRNNVDLNRLAVLCGTTNDNEILSDPTGNRRLIPIHVYSIDFDMYNNVDKTCLWMEAYELYKAGYNWQLDRADIEYLASLSGEFEMSITETELIMKFFTQGEIEMTASEIKVYIESKTNQKLSLTRLGMDLKRLGYKQVHSRHNNTTKRTYLVNFNDLMVSKNILPDDYPFD